MKKLILASNSKKGACKIPIVPSTSCLPCLLRQHSLVFCFPGQRKVFAPAHNRASPKSSVPPASFYGTPQMADPLSLLRGNLRSRVRSEMEERMAKMPPTSPYELVEEEGEGGEEEPKYTFTR